MLLQAFYMKGLDEIDAVHLPRSEVRARMIAKNISVMPTFMVYAIFLPVLMILHYCHQPTQVMVNNLIWHFILKPIRLIWYTGVYLICSLVKSIL